MLSTDTAETWATFDRLCAELAKERRGLTLAQLGGAHALARALCEPEPDEKRIAELRRSLGLAEDALP